MAEPGSWDGNQSLRPNHNVTSGTKSLKDQRNPSSGTGKLRAEIASTEQCKSCATAKRHTNNAADIASIAKSPKIEDGGTKETRLVTSRGAELDGSDTAIVASGRLRTTIAVNGPIHKAGTALHLLNLQCEQDMQEALLRLRRAQEAEFDRAKACLAAKKESILGKYELLEVTRREFSDQPVSPSLEVFDELLIRTGTRYAEAIHERENFTTMLTIGDGFGSVSKDDLKTFYRWPPEK